MDKHCLSGKVKEMLEEDLVEQLFKYAYNRCFSREEAEELCQQIIINILESVHKGYIIKNLEGYIWRIAHNTYTQHVKNIKKESSYLLGIEDFQGIYEEGFEKSYIESVVDQETFKIIRRKIAFLSDIYRKVIVMFYLEEMTLKEISNKLEIPENRVKQRLFSAKKQIKERVVEMNKSYDDYLLKPSRIQLIGTGNPDGSDERLKRLLATSIMSMCKKQPKNIKEMAQELDVPMVFVEDEVMHLVSDTNGLRKVDYNKYVADIIIIDEMLQKQIENKCEQMMDAFTEEIIQYLKIKEEEIKALEYLVPITSFSFIVWSIIMDFPGKLSVAVEERIKILLQEKGIEVENRPYSLMGISRSDYSKEIDDAFGNFYGCDGTSANKILGYNRIYMRNYYGQRLPWEAGRFRAGTNISVNPELMMILHAIEGLSINHLSEKEQEIVARAIQKGYLRRENNTIIPNVVIVNKDTYKKLQSYTNKIDEIIDKHANILVTYYSQVIKKDIPKHLWEQSHKFVSLSMAGTSNYFIERCIEKKLLHVPNKACCGEGILVVVEENN